MKAGAGKSKVGFKKAVLPLQGYPRVGALAVGFETELYARAFVFVKESKLVALVVLECGFISHHLKAALVDKCKAQIPEMSLKMDNLLLCAQNTHSAPGGHSHYAFHNISSKGFRPEIFNAYLKACFDALVLAWRDLSDCTLYLNADLFAEDIDVAFNRSLDAYNRNPDVPIFDEMQTHLALNRMMKQIRIGTAQSGNKGLINWFGVQANSVSASNLKVHSDNKGYAAALLENDQSTGSNFVAAFCQEAAADVSPNYYGKAKWWARGRYEDDFKSAYANGFLQFEKAREMVEGEEFQISIGEELDSLMWYVDMSNVACDPEFCQGAETERTGAPVAGLAFIEGNSPDIDGTDAFSTGLLRMVINYREMLYELPLIRPKSERQQLKYLKQIHQPKTLAIEFAGKKVLGYRRLNKLPLPTVMAEITEEVKRQYEANALNEHSWSPLILPLQLIRLGDIVVVGFPGDLSTTAGSRLRKTILATLEPIGILDVIINTYANEHAGYTVTPEEYLEQNFEGGYTLFGRMSLPAYQTLFRRMANELIKPEASREVRIDAFPPEFSKEELDRRSFR